MYKALKVNTYSEKQVMMLKGYDHLFCYRKSLKQTKEKEKLSDKNSKKRKQKA